MASKVQGIITIRPAVPKDIEKIALWQLEMAKETESLVLNLQTVVQGVTYVFEQSAVGNYLIAEVADQRVGSLLLLKEWSDWRAGNILWIHSVFVEPDYRKQGVFTAMYEMVKAQVLNSPSLKGIRLYVDKTNRPARSTYQNLGMNGDHYQTFEWMK